MADPVPAKAPERVTCPFCGLYCDDLATKAEADGALRVTAGGCPVAVAAFATVPVAAVPRIEGREVSLDDACGRAAEILGSSRLPLFAGLATDVAGAKAIIGLAEQTGGVVDHAGSEAMFHNILAMQDKGWMTTTLAEVKNRMDLLVVAGTDVVSRFPRFFERFVWNPRAMFQPDPTMREIVYLGDGLDVQAGHAPDGREPTVIPCDHTRLGEVFGALRALYHGRALQTEAVAGALIGVLDELARRMRAARYGVVTWAAADFEGPHGDLTVRAISDLITDINETTRFVCLPLGGSDNALGVAGVCTWQAGFPLRTSFADGTPTYDPHLFSWRRLLEEGEADALVWVSAFRHGDIPVATDVPTVFIGTPGGDHAREPEVYIPVGVPGLDHSGHVVRADAVASLQLHKLRDSGLPTTADVFAAIAARLDPTAAE